MANIIDAFPKGASGDTVQYATLPTASADNVGQIVQYVGVDTSTLTNGFFYICANDSGTYKWEEKPVSENTEGHTIVDTDGNDMAQEEKLKFTGFDVTDDSTNGVTDVGAVGLNADSLADITSGNISNGFVTNGMVYSTSEQVVGKWIDGKPLYQKTFVYSGSLPTNAETTIITLTGIDNVVQIFGDIIYNNAAKFTLPYVSYVGDVMIIYSRSTGLSTNTFDIVYAAKGVAKPVTQVNYTLQYTKTTD